MDQQGKILIDTSDTDYYISADLNNTSKQWDLTYSTINLQGDYVLNRAIVICQFLVASVLTIAFDCAIYNIFCDSIWNIGSMDLLRSIRK